MVKCLIRITTRVNVHLRMINHCYRDVKVRVLSLGPRLLGKALGVLPLYPALTGPQGSDKITPLSGASLPSVQPSYPPGKLTTEPARSVLYMDWPVLYSKLVSASWARWKWYNSCGLLHFQLIGQANLSRYCHISRVQHDNVVCVVSVKVLLC